MTDEEKPKVDTVDYVLEPVPPPPPADDDAATKDGVAEAKATIKASTKGGLIIFAIDISSSMNRVVKIPALQGRKLNIQHLDYGIIIAEWSAVRDSGQASGGVRQIRRLECIKEAVIRHLDHLSVERPNCQVRMPTCSHHMIKPLCSGCFCVVCE